MPSIASSVQKIKRSIKQERINTMQYNVEKILDNCPPPFRSNQEFKQSFIDSWLYDLRVSAYIFGDSYIGIPLLEFHDILITEDFKLAAKEHCLNKHIHTYVHTYLNIVNVLHIEDGKVNMAQSFFKLNIGEDDIPTESLCGLGIKSLNVKDGIMTGGFDSSENFVAKLTILKSLVKSEQPQYVFNED